MKDDYVYHKINDADISRDIKLNVIYELTEIQLKNYKVTNKDLYNLVKDYLNEEQKAKFLKTENNEKSIKEAENELNNKNYDGSWNKVFDKLRQKLCVNGNYREVLADLIRNELKDVLTSNGYKFKIPKKVITYLKEPVYCNNNILLKNASKVNKINSNHESHMQFPFFNLPDWILWKSKAVLTIRRKMLQNIVLNILYRAKITNAKDIDEVYGKLMYKLSKELGEDLLKKYENNKEVIVFLFENNNRNGWIDVNNLMSQIDML